MLGIKRLYTFVLQRFLPLFAMTFFICLFIVLMQFLWRYIDDLVGKGLGVDVLAELFFYAALTMIPMALPLAILLASLMTFGNLGEHFELTAMKASGVSLIKVMRPLIVLMVLVSIGAFFFQNNVLPVAQTKMWTLLYSMRQKSPELEIPEGVFYDQIPGYNLFVEKKDRESGTLHDLMIYDLSRGFDNASIILADSGRLAVTDDKTHLFLRLWQGESFENLREAGNSVHTKNVPYRRESFDEKHILLKFDANFNRMDEDGMRNQYVGKNIAELRVAIDSLSEHTDSVGRAFGKEIKETPYMGVRYSMEVNTDSGIVLRRVPDVRVDRPLNVDSLFRGASSAAQANYLNVALSKAKQQQTGFEFRKMIMKDERKNLRRHDIELQKKFTLSFACIIFFFIGAPLGAIIRKGGLGMPLVISVLLFIFYYIIDNTGYKMARDGKILVWEGMWLSSAVLLPLGIFFTYKAVKDSAVFNRDAYLNFFRKLVGSHLVRHIEMKELVMDDVVPAVALQKLEALRSEASEYMRVNPASPGYMGYWLRGYSRSSLRRLASSLEETVGYLSNSRSKLVINKLMDYPFLRSLWLYPPTNYPAMSWAAIILFPVGLPVYLVGRRQLGILRSEIQTVMRVSDEFSAIIVADSSENEQSQQI